MAALSAAIVSAYTAERDEVFVVDPAVPPGQFVYSATSGHCATIAAFLERNLELIEHYGCCSHDDLVTEIIAELARLAIPANGSPSERIAAVSAAHDISTLAMYRMYGVLSERDHKN